MPDPAVIACTHTLYEVLKDFQPALAALVALAAASIAYRGAVAKVTDDREVRNGDKLAAKVALMLQLRSVAARVRLQLSHISKDTPLWDLMDNALRDVPEFDEAWQKLILLPPSSMEQLDKARYYVRTNQRALEKPLLVAPQGATPEGLEKVKETKVALQKVLQMNGRALAAVCRELEESLNREIEQLHPKIR